MEAHSLETNSIHDCPLSCLARLCIVAECAKLGGNISDSPLSCPRTVPSSRGIIRIANIMVATSNGSSWAYGRRNRGELMKRISAKASFFAYLGAFLLFVGLYPGLDDLLDRYRFLHAIWHISVFAGAAFLVYGLETLRSYARRLRRIIQ